MTWSIGQSVYATIWLALSVLDQLLTLKPAAKSLFLINILLLPNLFHLELNVLLRSKRNGQQWALLIHTEQSGVVGIKGQSIG